MSTLDKAMPFHGPCGLCGGPDARHRVADAMIERVRAGEGPQQVGDDYGYTLEEMTVIFAHSATGGDLRRRKRRTL